MTKAKCQQLHAIKRAASRYGINLDKDNYKELCQQIKDQKGTFIRKQSNRISIWAITFKNKEVLVAYDKLRHTIVTFLPPENKSKQPLEWSPPLDQFEMNRRLENPTCPKCKGFGRHYKWFSAVDVVDFECINCDTKWYELLVFSQNVL